MREVCVGGGELIITDARLCGVVSLGHVGEMKVNSEHGTCGTFDIPHRRAGAVGSSPQRKQSRFASAPTSRVYFDRPTGAIQFDAAAIIPGDGSRPRRVDSVGFFKDYVGAVCKLLLGDVLVEQEERSRLEGVLNGSGLVEDDGELVAEFKL